MMTGRWKTSLLAVALSAQPAIPLGPKSTPQDILRCERKILVDGKALPCDSPIASDGEGLRMLISDTPEALSSLDLYQANRRSLLNTAYAGMFGLMIAAFAPRLSSDPSTRNLWVGGGLALTFGTFAIGKARLRANEAHLDEAIQSYNRVHPDRPIELRR
jgi:hypothetical protein